MKPLQGTDSPGKTPPQQPLIRLPLPRTAPGALSYCCSACGRRFTSSLSMDCHRCSAEPWLPCLLCNDAYFRTRMQLQEHLHHVCRHRTRDLCRRRRPEANHLDVKRPRIESPTTDDQSDFLRDDLHLSDSPLDNLHTSERDVPHPSDSLEQLRIDLHLSDSSERDDLYQSDSSERDDLHLSDTSEHPSSDHQSSSMLRLVESALGGYAKTFQITCSRDCEIDVDTFLHAAVPVIESTLRDELRTVHGVKFSLWLEANYISPTGESTETPRNFKTASITLYQTTPAEDIRSHLYDGIRKLQTEMQEHEGRGSGWTLQSIHGLQLRLSKCFFYRTAAERYVKLPKEIANRKACVNVQNNDGYCFKYAILSKHYQGNKSEITTDELNNIEHSYNFSNLFFPVSLNEISKFERQNVETSVNVFALDKQQKITPLKIVNKEKGDHFDLLLCSNSKEPENKHYVFIKDFEKLIRKQITKNRNRITVCKRCFTFKRNKRCRGDTTAKTWLGEHQKYCNTFKPAEIVLPSEENAKMTFKNISHHYKVPIVIYADLESTLSPISQCSNNPEIFKSRTEQLQQHEINSFAFLVKSNLPETLLTKWDIPTNVTLCREENAAYKLMTRLRQIAQNIGSLYRRNIPMAPLSAEQEEKFNSSTKCAFCETPFSDSVIKVKDHDHLTGEYRGCYCQGCNINLRVPTFVPVVFHNLSGYDSNFLIRVLGLFKSRISIIPSSSEKFISFSVYVDKIELRFLDSLKFTLCSLDGLVKTVPKERLKETAKMVGDSNKIDLCLRKGVYPYNYIDNTDKFKETILPPRECFYNNLTDEHITESDYSHAVNVWKEFNFKTLGEYHDFYLSLDVTLLCDIMETFREVCFENYQLDPFHSYTVPGLSWNAMLKKTKVCLDLITDYDMYLYVEAAVRGGLVACNLRHTVGNNPDLENKDDYDPSKPTSHIIYLDATNLYGSVMINYLPTGGFKWVENVDSIDYRNIPENSSVGYLIEADFEYPEEIHDTHNDLPLLPKSEIPPNGTTKKLLATLEDKNNYIAHHSIIALAEKLGLKVTKVRRALQFNQSDWLRTYVELNTKLRQNAKNDFEKNLFKLITNSVYGKSIENQKKRVNIKLVTTEKQFLKETAKVNFVDRTIISENLVAVHLGKHRIELNRPLYVGQCILDMSKRHMYNFHYNVMLKSFDNIQLIYTDTDSLIYLVTTANLNETLARLARYFDFSSYPKNHELYKAHLPENTKKIGTFKNETSGREIQEKVGLKAKMYAFRFDSRTQRAQDDVHMKAKGVKSSALKKQFLFDHYKEALFENKTFHAQFSVIRSRNHVVYTEKVSKKALNSFDDKRYILQDGIHTLAHGHYLLTLNH